MVASLSQKSKQWFADMGSKSIWKLGYRQGFSFIGVQGRKDAKEERAQTKSASVMISKVYEIRANLIN